MRAPKGSWTRPTQDRVREALFSMLAPRLAGARFLDLFAGSGVVGVEAWSRGAAFVCWVERNRRVARVLEQNVSELCAGAGVVYCDDVLRFVRRAARGEPFDVVYADPPYADSRGGGFGARRAGPGALCDGLRSSGLLAPGGLFIMEEEAGHEVVQPEGWRLVGNRVYGHTRLRLFGLDVKTDATETTADSGLRAAATGEGVG